MIRPLVTPLAQDVIAVWLRTATSLPILVGDRNEPRPSLPYVSFTFPRGRPYTGDRQVYELTSSLGTTTVTLTAAEGERAAAILGPALVELTREAGETADDFAARWATWATWWLRGRASASAVGSVVTVEPDAAGYLVEAAAIEGLTIASVDGGPVRRIERLYRATCQITIFARAGDEPGAEGDGLDTYSIESAIRETLSLPATKQILRGGWLRPTASPREVPRYASAVSGARRESRTTFDVVFGWTGLYPSDSEAIETAEFTTSLAAGGQDDPMTETNEATS